MAGTANDDDARVFIYDVLPSDAARHISRRKNQLALDLFLMRGPFWDAIAAIRARLGIVPVVNAPVLIYADDTPIPAADIRALHDTFIPEDCRTGASSVDDWTEFLSFCVYYDPPPDRLIDFATFSEPYPMSIVTERGMSPGMIAPPLAAARERWVVRPTADTTNRDVEQALKMIAAVRPRKKRHKETDDTLAVQCALWHRGGMTYPKIAVRLGYRLSPDEHGKLRRSWPVQRLVQRGRVLLGSGMTRD